MPQTCKRSPGGGGAAVHSQVGGGQQRSQTRTESPAADLVAVWLIRQFPFTSIADNTRWQRKPTTFDSLTEAVERTAATYRRAIWSDLDLYEAWAELRQ